MNIKERHGQRPRLTSSATARRGEGGLKRRVVACMVTFLVVIAGLVIVPQTASAESSSQITAQYPWPHNGCTSVPDNPALISFTYACNHHDGCYARHWADRGTCDAWFRNDMVAACNAHWYFNYTSCISWAWIYYGAVRLFGQRFYDSNGVMVRISTPMRTA